MYPYSNLSTEGPSNVRNVGPISVNPSLLIGMFLSKSDDSLASGGGEVAKRPGGLALPAGGLGSVHRGGSGIGGRSQLLGILNPCLWTTRFMHGLPPRLTR